MLPAPGDGPGAHTRGMQLTGFAHSCLLAEIDGVRILFDPGVFSHGFESLTDLDAIVVTHQHPDHADPARLGPLLAANPQAAAYCDPQSPAVWADQPWAGRFTACHTGDRLTIGAVEAQVVGGRHAVIHPDIPRIDNAGFLLGTADRPGLLLHPGDELSPPGVPVQVLALPATAPWSKLEETIDYYRAVAPEVAVPIHDAIVSEAGRGLYFGQLTAHGPAGSRFLPLPHGEPVDPRG